MSNIQSIFKGEIQIPKDKKQELKKLYNTTLFDDFVPWWEKNSIDIECGGYLTRLERNGEPYAFDKDMW